MSECPRCGSPDPARHPSMQPDGGEVQLCAHPWHTPVPDMRTAETWPSGESVTAMTLRLCREEWEAPLRARIATLEALLREARSLWTPWDQRGPGSLDKRVDAALAEPSGE